MKIPAPVVKFAGKAGNWLVKNGPKLMSVGGGLMAVGGAVMACEATLHADEVLDKHKQRMDKIKAAQEISEHAEEVEDVYTDKMMKRDKAVAYFETGLDFVKLYGPAFTVGVAGVGLMQSAFWVTERRRATAVAALTSVNEMYQSLLARESAREDFLLDGNPSTRVLNESENDGGEAETQLILDPNKESDPFFFIFDESNPNWMNKSAFLMNERFLSATIDAFNYRLSGYAVPQVWLNDVLKAWGMPEKDFGWFYGWNATTGDVIEYDIIPFLKEWDDDDCAEMPMLIETDMDSIRDLEASDIQEGYCFGIRLKSSSD